jgi:hypothetical protein
VIASSFKPMEPFCEQVGEEEVKKSSHHKRANGKIPCGGNFGCAQQFT